jgi:hypothetical protein
MKTAFEICQENGIVLRDYSRKHHYCTCPKCSPYRKPQNRKKKCLHVDVNDKGVRWFCNNCGGHGYAFYDPTHGGAGHSEYVGRVIERPAGRVIERPEKVIGRMLNYKSGRMIQRPLRRTITGGWV